MRHWARRLGILALIGLVPSAALAQDVRGSRDHPLLKRYPGSSIVRYETQNAANYTLPAGPLVRWDYAKAQPDFAGKKVDVEGELVRITYVVRPGASPAEVFGKLKAELLAKGFKPIYEARGTELGRAQGNLYQNLEGQLLEYSPKGAHFLSAKRDGAPTTAYVAAYVTAYELGTTRVRIRPGQAVAQIDIVEVKPTNDRLVVVSAGDISKGLETSGRVALYGILFDSNRSDIKPESRPAIDEIAKFLRSTPNARLDVVGHTDNVGGYDSNLDLSRARAAAVVGTLVGQYSINPQRLRASGVGFLAPVASNMTEDGRSKNRRVELLPQ